MPSSAIVRGAKRVGALLFGPAPAEPRQPLRDTILDAFSGRYVPLALIGRGGMGAVFRCYDKELGREVAIKCAKLGTTDREGRARMVREARTLAALSSPHVVRVYDVSIDASSIAIAMEHVPGPSVRQWLQARPRSTAEIMAVFEQVTRGLSQVHAAGFVHRDVKPDNMLLDPDGRALLADFGLATLLDPDDGPRSRRGPSDADRGRDIRTRTGAVVGTIAYMAPEQHRAERGDARADQYALCVSLWEALTGRLPFSSAGLDANELLRDKLRGPPAPSMEGTRLDRAVLRALERGLAPLAEDRWPSVAAFWQAATGRRRRSSRLGAVIVGSVLAGWGSWQMLQATPETNCEKRGHLEDVWGDEQKHWLKRRFVETKVEYAQVLSATVVDVLDDYAVRWTTAWNETCESLGRDLPSLDQERHLRCLGSARSSLRASVGTLSNVTPEELARVGRVLNLLPDVSRCQRSDALEPVPPPGIREEHDRVRAILDEAVAIGALGRYEQMQERIDGLRARVEQLDYAPLRARWSLYAGVALRDRGRLQPAIEQLRVAYLEALETGQAGLASGASQRLAVLLGEALGRHHEARAYALSALGLAREDAELEAGAYMAQSQIFYAVGDYVEAEKRARAAVARIDESSDQLPGMHNAVANALAAQGRYRDSEDSYRTALALLERSFGPQHPHTAATRASLAGVLQARGEYAEATTLFRDALRVLEQAHGEEHRSIAGLLNNLANTLDAQGKHLEAEVHFRRALEIVETTLGDRNRHEPLVRLNLGVCLVGQGRLEEARSELQRAVDAAARLLGPDHPLVGSARSNLGQTLTALGHPSRAGEELQRALSIFERRLGPEHPRVARVLVALAEVRVVQSRLEVATRLLRRADAIFAAADVAPGEHASAQFELAKALARLPGHEDEALQEARSARMLVGSSEASAELSRRIESWLEARAEP